MTTMNLPRFMLSAPKSGSGKTTLTCGILRALEQDRHKVAAFKSGPDYIDPMFHSKVVGTKSRNLDLFLLGGGDKGAANARRLLAENSRDVSLSVLEGAMGFYDGIGVTTEASAYDLAKATGTPVVIELDAKGAALSLAAQLRGFKDFRPDSNIQGFILNNANAGTYSFYKRVLEEETGLKGLGFLPYLKNCNLSSRHLGLVTAEEIVNLEQLLELLAEVVKKTVDLDGILKIAASAEPLTYEPLAVERLGKVRLAVAQDKAFCFYYQDVLDLFQKLGAEIVPFSPLQDKEVPASDGLYIGGGYPELYAPDLSANKSMLASLKKNVLSGKPCYAECGGYMYLQEHFQNKEGCYDWVGALPGTVKMTGKLTRFGYIKLTARKDNLFCKAGETLTGHEFHYSESTVTGTDFHAVRANGQKEWDCVRAAADLFAGYPHLHLCGFPAAAANFVQACLDYKQRMLNK